MGRVFKFLLFLVVLAAIVVLGYAIFSDLPAPTKEIVTPVAVPDE